MIERKDPSRIIGLDVEGVAAYIESDFKIRSGLCPNGHGLMSGDAHGQQCPACGFFCNTLAEKVTAQ